MSWANAHTIPPRQFVCGFCDRAVGGTVGYAAEASRYRGGASVLTGTEYIIPCPMCGRPNYFGMAEEQIPGPRFGHDVAGLDPDMHKLWAEIRRATSAKVYTLAVLGCRKMLMHIGVERGAPTNLGFLQYVDYLDSKNYIPPGGRGWVDHIRKKGNEQNHEIVVGNQEDAERLVTFLGMLLRIIYELPTQVPKP